MCSATLIAAPVFFAIAVIVKGSGTDGLAPAGIAIALLAGLAAGIFGARARKSRADRQLANRLDD